MLVAEATASREAAADVVGVADASSDAAVADGLCDDDACVVVLGMRPAVSAGAAAVASCSLLPCCCLLTADVACFFFCLLPAAAVLPELVSCRVLLRAAPLLLVLGLGLAADVFLLNDARKPSTSESDAADVDDVVACDGGTYTLLPRACCSCVDDGDAASGWLVTCLAGCRS